jgi:hypothetical protein
VQGWVVGDSTEHDDNSYVTITCAVCRRVHLVNSKTEKVIGDQNDDK